MLKAANSYLQTQLATITPGELLIMLYDACVKNLRQAQERIRERDVKNKGLLISKAIDIITELQSSLNAQKGGDIALNLQKLYFYCNTRLLRANMNMDTAVIEEVIKIISGIRDAYYQIMHRQNPEADAALTPTLPRPAAAAPPMAQTQVVPAAKPAPVKLLVQEQAQAAENVIAARGSNLRAFTAYANAHKQGA